MEEKQEKFDEKEMEKHEEKSTEEKNYEEKYRRDPLGAIVWAVILIWIGLVLLAENLGYLEKLAFNLNFSSIPGDVPFIGNGWTIIFAGMGVILLFEVVIRLLLPDYRKPLVGTVILAMVFFALAFSAFEFIWPLILIIVGASILLRGVFRSRE